MNSGNIETKEIRGITIKGFVLLIIHTVCVTGAVVGCYFALKNDIEKIVLVTQGDAKYNDLRMRNLELNYDILNKRLEGLQEQINQFESKKIEQPAK